MLRRLLNAIDKKQRAYFANQRVVFLVCVAFLYLISTWLISLTIEHTSPIVQAPDKSTTADIKPAPPKVISPPDKLAEWCPPLVKKLPQFNVEQCLASGLKASSFTSVNGFPLLMRDVPAKGTLTPRKILLMGGIHGDEKTAFSIVLLWNEKLRLSEGNAFQWRIAPIVNPDGLMAPKSTRTNANGVDLNRNFPTPNWDNEAPKYWQQKTRSDPRRFPGKTALSEPESSWIYKQIEEFQPDVIISVHAPFGVLDFDGKGTPPSKFGRLLFNRVGVYPGSLGNYGGVHKDIPVVTIELPNANQMPSQVELNRIWQDMLQWVEAHVQTQKNSTIKNGAAIASPVNPQ